MDNTIKIYGLFESRTTDGILAGAESILDSNYVLHTGDPAGAKQSEINSQMHDAADTITRVREDLYTHTPKSEANPEETYTLNVYTKDNVYTKSEVDNIKSGLEAKIQTGADIEVISEKDINDLLNGQESSNQTSALAKPSNINIIS